MNYAKILLLVLPLFCTAQKYKSGISIVQASAEFLQEKNLEIKKLKDASTFNFDISKQVDFFDKYKVEFLPTVILFSDGEEVKRWQANIMLELDCKLEDLQKEINKIIEDKF